jgi:hypothetical protein
MLIYNHLWDAEEKIPKKLKKLVVKRGGFAIVRPNAPFWCGWVNCLLPQKNGSKRINNNNAGGTD